MNDMESALDHTPFSIPEEGLKAADLDFYLLLRRQSQEGRLFFNKRRAVIIDVEALGTLRQQIVETSGQDLAKGIVMRFAYTQGYNRAEALGEAFDWDTDTDWLAAGSLLLVLEGVAYFEAEEITFDREKQEFYMRAEWRNSHEAEDHLKRYGPSKSPVCWMLTGYASGYATRFFGREVLAIETECVGKGDETCRFEIRTVAEWGSRAEPYLEILQDKTDRKQVEQVLAKRAAELEAVAEVATIAATVLETKQLLQTVVDLTKQRFGLYHAHIYLLNEAGETLSLAAGAGEIGQQMVSESWSIPFDREQSLVARAARTQHGVIVNDVRQDSGFLQNPLLPDTRSELAVPIIAADRLLGVLDVQSDEVNSFTQDDVRILTTLASQVGSAIRNARLFETVVQAQKEAESRLQETETLQRLSQSLAGTLQLNEIIDAFFQACTQLLGFEFVIFSLVDKNQQRIKAIAGVNVSDDHIRQANHPLDGDDIMANVIRTGRTEVISGRGERFAEEIIESEDMADRGVRVFTPIRLWQENIGLVELGFKEDLEATVQESQIRLMRIFIDQTALALERAQRYETSQKEARREQILREVTARIRSAADVETVMRTAAQEVGRALGRQAFVYLGNGHAGTQSQTVLDEEDA